MSNAPQKKKVALGAAIEVPEGGEITRPDGTTSKVIGGSYFADVPGVFTVGDQKFEATDK